MYLDNISFAEDLDTLKRLRNEITYLIKKDVSLELIMNDFINELKEVSEEFLYDKRKYISCISSSILVDNYKIGVIGGKSNRNKTAVCVDENTLFDGASMTKLFMGLLVLKLKKYGIIDFNSKISNYSKTFPKLDDYRIIDIIRMAGIIRTDGKLSDCSDSLSAFNCLKNTFIVDNDKGIYNYTDIGLMILSYVIEEIFSDYGLNMSFDEIMIKYLLEPLGLENTVFYPENRIVTGNGNNLLEPNDPKARKLKHPTGHAGLFTNANDLETLATILFNGKEFSLDMLKMFSEVIKEGCNKSNFGIFRKHILGLYKTYVPNEYSDLSFATEGFTGSLCVIDPVNKINNNILVNALLDNSLEKVPGFNDKMRDYQTSITLISLKMLCMIKHYKLSENKGFSKKIRI